MADPRATTTAAAKRADQERGVKYGCHCDLGEDEQPDGCVKDYGDDFGCIYAKRHRSREGCRYWQPVQKENVDA